MVNKIFQTLTNELLGDVIDMAPWGILLCDEGGIVQVANISAAEALVLCSDIELSEELIGRHVSDLIPGFDLRAIGDQLIECPATSCSAVDRSSLLIQLVEFERDGEVWLAVYIGEQERRLQRELLLEREATTDELSKLANRRAFQRTIEAHQDKALSLAIIDIDHFKNVNDVYGHLVGDDLIKLIGELLIERFSESSIIASRMGGDEFSVLFETSSADDIVQSLEDFRETLADEKVPGTEDFCATVSIGAVISLQPGINTRKLLTIADRSLYKAKAASRNQVLWVLLDEELDGV